MNEKWEIIVPVFSCVKFDNTLYLCRLETLVLMLNEEWESFQPHYLDWLFREPLLFFICVIGDSVTNSHVCNKNSSSLMVLFIPPTALNVIRVLAFHFIVSSPTLNHSKRSDHSTRFNAWNILFPKSSVNSAEGDKVCLMLDGWLKIRVRVKCETFIDIIY